MIHNNLKERLQITLLLIAVVALLWWIIQIYGWWDNIRTENYMSQLTYSHRILLFLSHSQHIQHTGSIWLISNWILWETGCQPHGTEGTSQHEQRSQRPEHITADITSLAPSRARAVAPKQPAGLWQWLWRSGAVDKATQVQGSKEGGEKEGSVGKAH